MALPVAVTAGLFFIDRLFIDHLKQRLDQKQAASVTTGLLRCSTAGGATNTHGLTQGRMFPKPSGFISHVHLSP